MFKKSFYNIADFSVLFIATQLQISELLIVLKPNNDSLKPKIL